MTCSSSHDHVSVTGSIINLFNMLLPFDLANYAGAGTNCIRPGRRQITCLIIPCLHRTGSN